MNRYLVFRLYAPLASWGTPAVGEERPTATYPGRSAIVGLLSAAIGIRRDEHARLSQLNDDIEIAVKQHSPGRMLRDYHTVQMPPTRKGQRFYTRKDELDRPSHELNTIVSKRDYRCDGLWIVAIRASQAADADRLDELAAALARPRFPLYFGRRACPPAAPLAPECVEENSWRESLNHEFPPIGNERARALVPAFDVLYSWEGEADALDGSGQGVESSEVWDVPVDRKRWQFRQRTEFRRYAGVDGGR